MPSHLPGQIAVVAGVAAILIVVMVSMVPPSAQVLVAVLSLPIGASLFATASATPRRRVR